MRGYLSSLSDRHLGYLAIGLFGLLGLVLVWTRLAYIDNSLWHDEAVTVLNFSGVGPGAIVLDEGSFHPNNHVAYNLLSWVTVSLLGESEAMYRLWSVVPGIAAIGLAAWWAWQRIGPVASVAFATIAVASPLHLEYAPQARGYGLALLAATLTLIAADRLARAYSNWTLLGFLGAGLLGIWTLITFAIVFVGQALALLQWRHLRVPMIIAVGAAGVLSLAFYARGMGGVGGAAGVAGSQVSGETIPLTAALLLDRPLEWLVIPTVTMLPGAEARAPLDGSGVAPSAPWTTWLDVAVLALLVLGLVALWRRGDRGLALILLVPPLFFNLYFSLDQQGTVTRHQLFLLPYIVLPVAIGIAEVGRIVAQNRFLKPVAIGLGVAAVVTLSGAIVKKSEKYELPRENFKQVANVIERAGIDTVVSDSLRPEGLRYYLDDHEGLELIELPHEWVEPLLCEERGGIAYIHHLAFSHPSWDPANVDCIVRRPLVRVRVPQRARGSAIDVWIIEPRANSEVIRDDIRVVPEP